MDHNWPDEPRTICPICGASFLARTAAETGGICRRHVTIDNIPLPLPQKEDFHLIVSPVGKTFTSSEDLPTLPFPKKIVVGPDYLNFDGWIIRICPCSKSLLGWISQHASRWCKENHDPVIKEQVNAMISAIQYQVVHGDDAEECIPETVGRFEWGQSWFCSPFVSSSLAA